MTFPLGSRCVLLALAASPLTQPRWIRVFIDSAARDPAPSPRSGERVRVRAKPRQMLSPSRLALKHLRRQRHHRVGAGRDAREAQRRLGQHALHEEARRRSAWRPSRRRRPARAPSSPARPRRSCAHISAERHEAEEMHVVVGRRRRHCRASPCAFCMNHIVACCKIAERRLQRRDDRASSPRSSLSRLQKFGDLA